MDKEPQQSLETTRLTPSTQGVTLTVVPAHATFYQVSEENLETLGAGYTSVALALFSMFFGVLATLLVTLFTVPLDIQGYAVVSAMSFASFGLVVVTGVQAYRDWRTANKFREKLKAGYRTTGV